MKIKIRSLCAVAGLSVCISLNQAKSSQFPICTNNSATLTSGGVFDGTNYLVALQGTGLFNRANPNLQIAAQRFSQTGTLVGSLIDLGRNASGSNPSAQFPKAAFDGINYLEVWTDNTNSGNDIYGQFISIAGALVGPAFPISQSPTYQNFNGIIFDGTNYFVVWEGGSSLLAVYGQRVSKTGALVGGQILISPSDNTEYGNIRLCTHENSQLVSGATNYFVTFTGGNNSSNVMAQFVSPNGLLVGSVITIKADGIPISGPNACGVGFDGTNYLVAWHEDVSSTEHDLLGQLVSRTGGLVGGVVTISTPPAMASVPSLTFDGANYLAIWSDSFVSTNQSCQSRFIDPAGNSVGPQFMPLSSQGTDAPALAGSLYDGQRFVVVGLLGSLSNAEIYGTFIPASTSPPTIRAGGYRTGMQFPLQLSGTPGINYEIQISTNLAPANWVAVVTNSPTNGPFTFIDLNATNKSRFYRAVRD